MAIETSNSGRWVALAVTGVFALQACGGGGGSSSPPAPPPPPANRAPVFTSPAATTVSDGASGTVYTVAASDADGDALTFSLNGGADAGVFSFSADARTLSPNAPLDFDTPRDANADNVYEVNFRVTDGKGGEATLAVAITVQAPAATGMALAEFAAGFDQPLFLTGIPGTDSVAVVEKGGTIRAVNAATGAAESVPFLDVISEVSENGEQGLLGLAFSPDFATDRTFYVNLTNNSGTTEIRRYQTFTTSPLQADPATMNVILTNAQVDQFHNGGWIGFGGDGLLYLATGDGGSGGGASANAQDRNSLSGKILRIDVSGDDFPADANRDYAIPPGNAFPDDGSNGAPEVFALGLRNPWRSSFDPVTGDLFIADVGQGAVEEINRMRPGDAGANYGWDEREGTQAYNGGANSPSFTAPVAQYFHGSSPTQGNSITGGYVYRGNIQPIRDHYLFADFASGNVWSVPVSSLTVGQTLAASQFNRLNGTLDPNSEFFNQIASFGMDNDGEIYIISISGSIYRIEGAP